MGPIIYRTPQRDCRLRRRLLSAARGRFAEDRLADAVSGGTRQAVLIGTALDTFAAHNPYRDLRVFQLEQADGCLDIDLTASEFDPDAPVFVIRLGYPDRPGAIPVADARGLVSGTEIVFDYLADTVRECALAERLRNTGWELLEDLDSATLAAHYLDLPEYDTHSAEPRVIRARVANNAGRPPSSLSAE
ncbi:class I SAM-dependent methyltransferase [Nocardia sp. NPDC051030]|uniref:class I SAM-dependent methyltransferase n=1 Tax=Nocardia sp. NPDC051030 TaxID=3155162 RepID=UPI0034236A20